MSVDPTALLTAAGLDPRAVFDLAARALAEDLGGGVDITSVATVPADAIGTGVFVPRRHGVMAGLAVAGAVMSVAGEGGVTLEFLAADGDVVEPGTELLRVRGPVRVLLLAERTSLNLLCHLSGVATLTRAWVDAVAGTGARIRDSRKTTPGLRALEKYAVRCGGGVNHRMSLSDAAQIKDNHVLAAGGVTAAFRAVRDARPDVVIEVECDTIDEVTEAVSAGADLLLLDNMGENELRAAVAVARAAGARTEASGGLSLESAARVAATGVDYLSVGALTHSAPVLDIGFDLVAAVASATVAV